MNVRVLYLSLYVCDISISVSVSVSRGREKEIRDPQWVKVKVCIPHKFSPSMQNSSPATRRYRTVCCLSFA